MVGLTVGEKTARFQMLTQYSVKTVRFIKKRLVIGRLKNMCSIDKHHKKGFATITNKVGGRDGKWWQYKCSDKFFTNTKKSKAE